MVCAPLKKSPNWASHIAKILLRLTPYSKPSTENSLKGLLTNSTLVSLRLLRGTTVFPVSTSVITPCLWLNVPLEMSCPLSLTGQLSNSRDPIATASALAQSSLVAFNLGSIKYFESLGWGAYS